jgi:hypothetical protein
MNVFKEASMSVHSQKDKLHGHNEPRETGSTGGHGPLNTPSVPDPQTKKRPLTPDEKVDEASLESMDASDPPSFSPSSTGAAPGHRKSDAKPPKH